MQVSSASSAQALEMANRMRQRMFSRADQDGSGGLGLDEFRAMRPGNSGTQAADSAGGTAATDRSAEIFSRLDTDGDGSVSAEELEAGRPAQPPHGGAFSAGSMAALLSGQEASETGGTDAFFARLDSDGDGSLSAAEFAAGRPSGGPRGPDAPPPEGTEEASGTSQADTLSELIRKAMESYLQATTVTAQGQTSTLASA